MRTTVRLETIFNPMDYPTPTLRSLSEAIEKEFARRDEVGETDWTTEVWGRFLAAVRLSHPGHAKVLAALGKSSDGVVSREQVLKIMGRAKDAHLSGYRKPFSKTVERLHAQDPTFPTESPVYLDYDGTSTAQALYIDSAALPYLREAIAS